MLKLGFIGLGNMGEAILRGLLQQNILPPHCIYIYDINLQKQSALQREFSLLTAQSPMALCAACDMVLLAVKPNVCAKVLEECKNKLENKALLSIVTGWTRDKIEAITGNTCRILRIMPNTPCMVGNGMSAFDLDHTLTEEELVFAGKIFSCIGRVEMVSRDLMAAVTGVSGSGPAYVYLFIEALADGGVRAGLPRDVSYRLAAQTVLGSAQMVLQTGQHPGALKDAVCSPGGTTIEAVAQLEEHGLRNSVLHAVKACVDKVQEMSK